MLSASSIFGRDFAIMTSGLDGLAMRQEAHSANIANASTPNYVAKTVNFESTLKDAITAGDQVEAAKTGGSSLATSDASQGAGELNPTFAMTPDLKHAGVNQEAEVTGMMTDSMRFRVLVQQVNHQISSVRNIIAETGRS